MTIRNEFASDRGHIDINRRGTYRAIAWISFDSMELEAYTSVLPSKSKNDPNSPLSDIYISILL